MAPFPTSDPRWRSLMSAVLATGLWATPGQAQTAAQDRVAARYRQMLQANPTEGTALDRLWKMAEANGATDRLLEEFAAKADEGDFAGIMIHGLLLRRKGGKDDVEAARNRFEQAAEKDPTSPLPYLALADGLEGEPRAEALEKAATLLPATSPLLPGLLQKTGEAWMALDKAAKAGEAWERMVGLDPANIELRQRLAEAYMAADAAELAAPHYDYLEKHGDPATRAGALRSLARLRHEKGDTVAALDLLEKAIALTSADNWLRSDLIVQMIRFGQQSGSEEALARRWKAEAEAAPGSILVWQKLVALHRQTGHPEEERVAAEKLLELQPENQTLKRDLARLLVKLNELETAAPLLDELLKAQPAHRPDVDLIFHRATLDVRIGKPEEAENRLEALREAETAGGANETTRQALTQRVLGFYQEHRMLDALEAMLRHPEGDPVELALFLFKANRGKEAAKALERVPEGKRTPAERAQAHQAAAERLKQAGELEAALEEWRRAVAQVPESREMQMALGDLALSLGGDQRQTAVEALTQAVALSKEGAEKVEADQKLFRAYEALPTVTKEPPRTLRSAAGKAMEALLSAPTPEIAPEAEKGAALTAFIKELDDAANADASNPARWLRLARWHFWKRDFTPAREALEKAFALRRSDRESMELGVSIAQAGGDPTEAVQWLNRLIKAHPDEARLWQKQLAMIQLQSGEIDEGIKTLETLAADGDPAALADLARGQQQADRWYDALETWQRIYASAKYANRYDSLQPLIRVMQRLEMHPRAAETLWNAYEEQADPTLRSAILADLIAQCKNRNTLPWLLEKLQARTEKPGTAADLQAWASALKAAGKGYEAYTALKSASTSAPDRAAAEEELAKEAEELGDFAQAAHHQHQRLMFLPAPAAEEWGRLATLQEAALDYPAADESYRQLAQRFPRNTAILLSAAAYFEKWGEADEAAAIYGRIVEFDPMALSAAAGVVRLSSDLGKVAEAARKLLAHSRPETTARELILPEAPTLVGNHLRALFQVIGAAYVPHGGGRTPPGRVTIFNERGHGSTLPEWRLEAIRALARQVSEKDRTAWAKRWRSEKEATASEVLWALYYARADREMMAHLIAQAERDPASQSQRAAIIWMGLSSEAWPDLARWLWGPGRASADYDNFRSLLGVWAPLGRPLDSEALLRKAPVGQAWAAAEVLASKDRLRDAAEIGQRLLKDLPTPVTQLGAEPCLNLSYWLMMTGEMAAAETLLRQLAVTPADSLDAPTYAAQRTIYRLLSPLEREAWVRELLNQSRSPVFKAYTTALIRALEGTPGPMQQAVERLARLGSGTLTDAPSADRSWNGLLRAGIQLEEWHLYDAAIHLWEAALSDPATVHLQGERVRVYTSEIERRLAAAKLTRADLYQAPAILERMATQFSMAELQQIASQLNTAGYKLAAAQVQEVMARKEPRMPLGPLVKAYQETGDEATLRAMVEEWCGQMPRDLASAPAMLETLARWDRPRAIRLAAEISAGPGGQHPGLLMLLAQWQLQEEEWQPAAETFQRLLAIEPHHPTVPIGLATAQAAMGYKQEALEQLNKVTRRTPGIDLKRLELALEVKDFAQARQIGTDLTHIASWEPLSQAGRLFIQAGKQQEGAELLAAALDSAESSGRQRAAFEIQKTMLLQMAQHFPKETGRRWQQRLNRLAKGWPDLLSAAVETGRDSRVSSMKEQIDDLTRLWAKGSGDPVAGAWLFSHLLDTPIPADEVLDELLACPETSTTLLRWMRTRATDSGKPEFCVLIDRELLRRHPEATDDLVAAIRTLHSLGDKETALTLLEGALPRLLFSRGSLAGQLALLAYELGDTARARELFEEAIAQDDAAQQTTVYLGYARLLMMDGDFPATKRVLRQAFRNPANHDAQTIVEYLRRSGRNTPEQLPTELRDLNLRPAVREQVEKLLSGPPAMRPSAPHTAEEPRATGGA